MKITITPIAGSGFANQALITTTGEVISGYEEVRFVSPDEINNRVIINVQRNVLSGNYVFTLAEIENKSIEEIQADTVRKFLTGLAARYGNIDLYGIIANLKED